MKHLLLIPAIALLLLAVLIGCEADPTEPTPIYVTEVFVLDDGREVVLTLEVTATPEESVPTPEPTIPVAQSIVELDVATVGAVGELDPQGDANNVTATVIDNVYVGLTRVDAASNQVVGELAASWQSAESGRIWTFDLRDDVFWVQAQAPPGGLAALTSSEAQPLVEVEQIRPIVAADVVAAMRRTCDRRTATPNTFIYFIIEGCEQIYGLGEPSEEDWTLLGVRALSETRLEVRLVEPAAYFLPLTALQAFRPIPADRVDNDELDWLDIEDLVTSGPFVFSTLTNDEAEPNPVTVLQQNPFWPDALRQSTGELRFQPIERVNLYRYFNQVDAVSDYDKDLLDVAAPLASDIPALVEGPAKPPPLVTDSAVFYLGFNFDSPAFGLPEVRRAFSAAIDRERLIEEVYGEEGLPMRHLAPPDALLAPPIGEVGMGFNPDFALFQLLNSGFGACVTIGPIRYLINATDDALRHAESLIQMWVENLGCESSQFAIEQVQFGTLLARTQRDAGSQRPDLFDLGWIGFYPDAHNWYADVIHCEFGDNRPKRPCSEIDALITQAGATIDTQARAQIYRDIENRLFNQDGWAPLIPLYLRGTYRLEQDWITRLGDAQLPFEEPIIRYGLPRFDLWEINQELKDLERSQ